MTDGRARRWALRTPVLLLGPLVLATLAGSIAWAGHLPAPPPEPRLQLGGPSEAPSFVPSAPTPAVTVAPVVAAGGRVTATEPVEVSADVTNVGPVDAVGVRVTFFAALGDGPPIAIESVILDLSPGATGRADVDWTPGAPGTWLVSVRIFGSAEVGPSTLVRVEPAADPGAGAVLDAQQLPTNALVGIVLLLAVGVFLAAAVGTRLARP